MKDRVFMSYKHHRIWYNFDNDGTIYYMVARGNGTDEYFMSFEKAMEWIDKNF